jgi:single-strand DNA-binding protein
MIYTTIAGNLGKDCRTNNVNGTAVCNFSVAATVGYGEREQTLWFDCALWGKRAESGLVDYLTKGQKVVVVGEQGEREHEGKTYHTLRVTEVKLMGDKGQASQQSHPEPQPAAQQTQAGAVDDFDDDIPF